MGFGNVPGQGSSQSPIQVRDALQTLTGGSRLDAGAVKNLPSGGGGLSAWQLKTSNYTAVAGDRLRVDATAGDVIITLPITPTLTDADIWIQRLDLSISKVLLRSGTNKFNSQANKDAVFSPSVIQLIDRISYVDSTIGWLNQDDRLTYQTYTPPAGGGVSLTYVSNGDTNGLFYYLGTNKGTAAWANPYSQLVYSKLAGSGSFDNYPTMTNRVVNSHPDNTWLEFSPYIQVDLGAGNAIIPSYVSIRSWVNSDRLPRNFKIQGSNDGTAFTDLLTVTNNTSITGGSQWLSLPITGVSTAYRYLRYTAFTPGDSNNAVEVALAEWEFYGVYQQPVINLTHVSDGDANGVFYYLGTANGSIGTFTNPVTNAAAAVLPSSIAFSLNPNQLTDRVIGDFYTNSVVNSWIAWDLKTLQLSVNKYTLRNRDNVDNYMRSWVLEGTNTISSFDVAGVNAATWAEIDTRTNDATLTTANQYYTLTPNASNVTAYRYLRYRITGVTSSSAYYLCMGEFEFYGNLT